MRNAQGVSPGRRRGRSVVSRRLRTGGAVVLLALVSSVAVARADPPGFSSGVAAGEVTPSSAMLWTRADQPGEVTLKVSRSAALASCSAPSRKTAANGVGVLRKSLAATAATDNTVRSVVSGLSPGTPYHYRFCRPSAGSRLGRFMTAPAPASSGTVRFGVTGDADGTINPATGAPAYNSFEVYRRMDSEGNQFNVNLGDVMYSDSAVAGAPVAVTLGQKWAKYQLNLTYPNLRRLRGNAGLYSHWDDHEFIDNFSVPVQGGTFFGIGAKAFLDYNPTHYTAAKGLYRTFRWGRNVELFFLDERAFRSAPASADPVCNNPATALPDPLPLLPQRIRAGLAAQIGLPPAAAEAVSPACQALINDPTRTMLGAAQLQAFERDVRKSKATFKVILNEVPIQGLYWDPYDRWEGYAAERRALLTYLKANVSNVVFLTTDFHANMINDVRVTSFEEEGPSLDTGFYDVVIGPVALKTFAVDTDLKTGIPGASQYVRALFTAPRPLGLGMRCAALDTYSYAEVVATSKQLTVALKDAQGQPVKETPRGPACTTLTIPRR
ncbi:MAG: alkaline phosphatase [Solirubrobacteraceae bacterium]|nr:alkaline phosphatase [Solirubrobacteraceae bacterium]